MYIRVFVVIYIFVIKYVKCIFIAWKIRKLISNSR